jgi:nucleoside-diphosphate-sugar epimerase
MPQTVVVTGITTFLGMHIAQAFSTAGWRVVGTFRTPPHRLDSLRAARWDRVAPVLHRAVALDLCHASKVRDLVEAAAPAVLVHQAGIGSGFALESYDLATAQRLHMQSLDAIFTAMARVGGAVVTTGSGMEYGDGPGSFSEEAACWPRSPYGLAKLTATLRARQLAFRFAVPTRVARVFTIFGELDAPDRLATRILERLRGGQAIHIAPSVERDICDVADVAEGFRALALDAAQPPLFDVVNLSHGSATPLTVLARLIADKLGADPALIVEDSTMVRANEAASLVGNSDKARARMGWAPHPIEHGIERLIAALPASAGSEPPTNSTALAIAG